MIEVYTRPYYLAPVVTKTGMAAAGDPIPSGAYLISSRLTFHGHVVNGAVAIAAHCASAGTRGGMNACVQHLGYEIRSVYQPAERYWTFQWIEFTIFAAIALAITTVALVVLARRDV